MSCADCPDTAEYRKGKGCLEPTAYPQFILDTGDQFFRCPVTYLNRESLALIGIFNMMEMGHLPYKGGYLEQPAYLMERMKLIRAIKIKAEDEEMENAKRKSKGKAR